jgi:uncharacterized protein YjbI with pentapeptide repeats
MGDEGSWLQFANRSNKFKGSYFQDFLDVSGDITVRNDGNIQLNSGNLMLVGGDISMNGYIYCYGALDHSGNSLGGAGGEGGGLTSQSVVSIRNLETSETIIAGGLLTAQDNIVVVGTADISGNITAKQSTFSGHMQGTDASFSTVDFAGGSMSGHLIPSTNNTYDIGSADKKVRDLYVSENSIWIGDQNKIAISNNKVVMKKLNVSDTKLPYLFNVITPGYSVTDQANVYKGQAVTHIGKTGSENLSTYSVSDWVILAQKTGLGGLTNHSASDVFNINSDFEDEDGGQWQSNNDASIEYPGHVKMGANQGNHQLSVLGGATMNDSLVVGSSSYAASHTLVVQGTTKLNGETLIDGATNINGLTISNTGSLGVIGNASITGTIGVGTPAQNDYHLDVSGKTHVSGKAYFNNAIVAGENVTIATDTSGSTLFVKVDPVTAGDYPDVSHNIIMDVPNAVYRAVDKLNATRINSLEIDSNNRTILPFVRDASGALVNQGMTNGWQLGGPGANRFDSIHARDISISTEAINIEDSSGNKIAMSFDATTGSVDYTVTTKDTVDASGETFVIKGVQTQKVSSGGGTIDPALLEFTGLSFGDTFDALATYDLASTYHYNLTTTTYSGDGGSTFTDSASAQGLDSFTSPTNVTTLLGLIPTKESVVILVGNDDRADGGLNGIDTPGAKVDLTGQVISVTDDDGGTTLKWTVWGSEATLNAATPGNYLNYIELKQVNMVSGTYFIAKTGGTILYNNIDQDNLQNSDLVSIVNGDLFLYIDRSPGNNWTKIPVSLPQSASITTQMLANSVISTSKLANSSVTAAKIAPATITGAQIANSVITSSHIQAGAISGSIFADGDITGAKISSGTITNLEIADSTIGSTKLTSGSVTLGKIGVGAVSGANIVYMDVSGDRLMNNSINTARLEDASVTTVKVANSSITSVKLATGVINDSSLLGADVVTTANINNEAVTREKIENGAIDNSKMSAGAISNNNIVGGTITADKLHINALDSKMDVLTAGTGIAFVSGKITSTVNVSSINASSLQDGSVTLGKLSSDIYTGVQGKLEAGTGITIDSSNKISSFSSVQNNSIVSAMIQDGSITANKLAYGLLDSAGSGSSGTSTPVGSYSGTYTTVAPYASKENLGDIYGWKSRISSDGLLHVAAKGSGITGTLMYIRRRDVVTDDWTDINTITNYPHMSANTSYGNTYALLNSLAIDSLGNNISTIHLHLYGNWTWNPDNAKIYFFDSSNSNIYMPLISSYTVSDLTMAHEFNSTGDKMAMWTYGPYYNEINIVSPPVTNNSVIVAGSEDTINTLMYSSNNGVSWNGLGNTIFSWSCKHVTTNGLMWVAVGSGTTNTLATSVDGITWVGRGMVFDSVGYKVKHNGLNWVAVGSDTNKLRNIAYSADGITWSYPVAEMFSDYAHDVVWAIDKWWVVGSGDAFVMAYSSDGLNWTGKARINAAVVRYNTIAFDGTTLMAAGKATTAAYQAWYSHDYGTTWVNQFLVNSVDYEILTLDCGRGMWVAAVAHPQYQIISNAANAVGYVGWTGETGTIFTDKINSVHYDGKEKWIATGVDADPTKHIQTNLNQRTLTPKWNEWGPLTQSIVSPGDSIFIICATDASNTMFYSTDAGAAWTGLGNSMFSVSAKKSFYNKKIWMVVGEGDTNTIATSNDGINWTGRGLIFSEYGTDIYYKNGLWVATGLDAIKNRNIAYSSDDGVTWTYPAAVVFNGRANAISYCYDQWFVGGLDSTNHMARSDDNCVTWTPFTVVAITTLKEMLTIATDDLSLIVGGSSTGGNSGDLYTSTNGTSWTRRYTHSNTSDTSVVSVIYSGGRFHMLFNAHRNVDNHYLYSTTGGVTWAGQEILFTGQALHLSSIGPKLIAVGTDSENSKRTQQSIDNGDTWTDYTPLPTITTQTTVMALRGQTNTMAYSTDDGTTWTGLGKTMFNIECKKAHFNGRLWIAVGEGTTNTVATSTDGINWTGRGMIFNNSGNDVYYYCGMWVAVGEDTNRNNSIAYSTDDGVTWTYNNTDILTLGNAVVHNGINWIAGGYWNSGATHKSLVWSSDGITWVNSTSAINLTVVKSIAIDDGGTIMAVGKGWGSHYNNSCYVSTNNGVTWTYRGVNFSHYQELTSIINIYNTWYVTGISPNNQFAWSINAGASWAEATNLFTEEIYNLSYDTTGAIYAYGRDKSGSSSVQKSTNRGTTWETVVVAGVSDAIDYTHVIVGTSPNTISYSKNGSTWTGLGTSIFDIEANKARYNGINWVAVGEGSVNTLAISTDGETWTGKGKIFSGRGNDVRYHGGMWVAVGEDSSFNQCIAYSINDGTDWSYSVENIDNPIKMMCNAIIRVQGKWIVGGYSSKSLPVNERYLLLYSDDGINWVGSTLSLPNRTNTVSIKTLAYDGGYYIIAAGFGDGVHVNNIASYSNSNGDVWASFGGIISNTNNADGKSQRVNDIIYSRSHARWFAVGRNGSYVSSTFASAENPIAAWSVHKTHELEAHSIQRDPFNDQWVVSGKDYASNNVIKRSNVAPTAYPLNTSQWDTISIGLVASATTIVAVASNDNTLMYSLDKGVSWVGLGKNIFDIAGKKVVYNNGIWVAVGEGTVNTVATSPDGISWTGRGKVFGNLGKDVYYNGGIWVAVGDDDDNIKCIAYSTNNGVTWSNPVSAMLAYTTNVVIHSGTQWYVAGRNTYNVGNLAYSPDGITWTIGSSAPPPSQLKEIYTIATDNNNAVVVAGLSNNHYAQSMFYTINDGASWTSSNSFTGNNHEEIVNNLYYESGQWLALGRSDARRTSYSFEPYPLNNTWTGFTSPEQTFTFPAMAAIHDGSKWLFSGYTDESKSAVLQTTDHVVNKSYFANTTAYWGDYDMTGITNTFGTQIAVGSGTDTISYTTDGTTWTGLGNTIFSVAGRKVYYNNKTWIAVGEGATNTLATSPDGITWTGRGMIFSVTGHDIHYHGNKWVAVGEDADKTKCIAYSTDEGATWTNPAEVVFDIHSRGVNYITGLWCVVGASTATAATTFAWSIDGITWTSVSTPNYTQMDGLAIAGNAKSIYIVGAGNTSDNNNFKSDGDVGMGWGAYNSAWDGTVVMNGIVEHTGIWIQWGNSTSYDIGTSNQNTTTTWNKYKLFTNGAIDVHFTGSKWVAIGKDANDDLIRKESIVHYPTAIAHWTTVSTTLSGQTLNIFSRPEQKLAFVGGQSNHKFIDKINSIAYTPTHDIVKSVNSQGRSVLKIDVAGKQLDSIVSFKKRGEDPCVLLGTGANTINYSLDKGYTWTGLGNTIFSVSGRKAKWNGTVWIAVGEGDTNTLATSTDGINWTGRGMVFSVRGNNVSYFNNMWIAVGEDAASNKSIAYSTNNGVSWISPGNDIFDTAGNAVEWAHDRWIAVGTGTVNTLAESVDGITWTGGGMLFSQSGNGIAVNGYVIVIGGEDAATVNNIQYKNLWAATTPVWVSVGSTYFTAVNNVITFAGGRFCVVGTGTDQIRVSDYQGNSFIYTMGNPFSVTARDIAHTGERWTVVGEDADPNKCMFILEGISAVQWHFTTQNRATSLWTPTNYTTGATVLNGIAWTDFRLEPLVKIPIGLTYFPNNTPSAFYGNRSNSNLKMSFSGDGTKVAIGLACLSTTVFPVVRVYDINYTTGGYTLEYDITGTLNSHYFYGRDVTLNHDGSLLAYSYGGHPTDVITEDTVTYQIPRVVIYSRDAQGAWNTLPDVTFKGPDYANHFDGDAGTETMSFMTGWGENLKFDKDGTTLMVGSHNNGNWVGIRVFKRISGVWTPYYKTAASGIQGHTFLSGLDMTENGQIITFSAADNVHIQTFPNNTSLFTNVTLAPGGDSAYMKVAQDETPYNSQYGIYSDWHNAVNIGGRIYSYPNAEALTHSKEFSVQSTNTLSFYTGVPLVTEVDTTDDISQYNRMFIDETGLVGIGKKAVTYNLDVSGSINATSNIYSSGGILSSSDDRLKDNETRIENAVQTIMKITPEIYDKKSSLGPSTGYVKESGLIAQDIWYNTPELRHLVHLGNKHDGDKYIEEDIEEPNEYYNKWDVHKSNDVIKTDASGNPLHDLSGNVIMLSEGGEDIYSYGSVIVDNNDPRFKNPVKITKQLIAVPNIVPLTPTDILDVTLTDDIQNDPDYTALGWGVTPASINYTGLTPYLIKAIQEQQAMIETLITKVESLENP